MTEPVVVEVEDRILVITIDRPQARNAVDGAVSVGLAAAIRELDSNPDLSVAILTGAGDNFCAGMDLKAFVKGEQIALPGLGLGFTERPPVKPIISAVEGFALAGGTELVLATDLVVASTAAKFGIPEVTRGLVAGGGALLRLQHRIPYQKAMEFALTGRAFGAEEAHGYGFVNTLCDPGSALEVAKDLARRTPAMDPRRRGDKTCDQLKRHLVQRGSLRQTGRHHRSHLRLG